MNKFIKIKIILFAALIGALIIFSGCAAEQQYSGRGTAVVKVTMDRQYENLVVSSPEAQIENEDLIYTLKFNNRSQKDIIITSPGYQTLIINVSTAQLSGGEYTVGDVSLSPSKIMLTVTLQGVSSAEEITLENVDGDNIKEYTAKKNKITVQLKELADTMLKVSGEGIKDNTFSISASQFINYKAELKIPILSNSDNRVALTVYNDIPVPDYCYLTLNDYFYDDVIQEKNHTVSSVFYLDSGTSYFISDQSNSSKYTIDSNTIDMLLNTNPYIYVPLSQIIDNNAKFPISFSKDIENYNEIGKWGSGYEIKIIDLSNGRELYFNTEQDQNNEFKFFISGLYEGQQLVVSILFNNYYPPSAIVHYKHTVNKQDLTQGIEIQNKQELTQLEVNFIDEKGEPFVPGEDLSVKINNYDGDYLEIIQYYDGGNGFFVDIEEFKNNNVNYINLSMSGCNLSYDSIHEYILYNGRLYITFLQEKTLRINFVDTDGEEVNPHDIIIDEDYLREGENYIEILTNNNFNININENYLNMRFNIEFNKNAFEFVDEEGGYYQATITVYKVKAVRIKFTFNKYGDMIDKIELYGKIGGMIEREDFNNGLLININEKSSTRFDVNAYSYNNEYSVYDRIAITDDFENLKEEYSFVLSVTKQSGGKY